MALFLIKIFGSLIYKGNSRGFILFIVRILLLVSLRQSLQMTYSSSIDSMSSFKWISTSIKIAYPVPFVQIQQARRRRNIWDLTAVSGMVGFEAISNNGTRTLRGFKVNGSNFNFDFDIFLIFWQRLPVQKYSGQKYEGEDSLEPFFLFSEPSFYFL